MWWGMFRGMFEHTIDEKGRVAIPARFREFLQATNDDRLVITNFSMSAVRCLDVYPCAAWLQLEERMRAKPHACRVNAPVTAEFLNRKFT